MYAMLLRARRVLPRPIRRRCCESQPKESSIASDQKPLRSGATSHAAVVAALACVAMSCDPIGVCKRETIVWVDVYGKKVAVHEKAPEPSQEPGRREAARRSSRFFPYVIIGYGVAGQSALGALLEREPGAKVLVVDARPDARPHSGGHPWDGNSRIGGWAVRTDYRNVEFATGVRATSLDADRGVLMLAAPRVEGEPGERGDGGGKDAAALEEVSFGRCLLALGSRSRPPPPGYVDPAAFENVSLLGSRVGVDREVMKREVAEGRAVTVVGSSWQALELVCCLQEARESSGKGGGGVRMVFSDFAPLDHVLPRYLSVALLRRLNKRSIKTMGHSSLHWIGPSNPSMFSRTLPPPPQPGSPSSLDEAAAASLTEGKADLPEMAKADRSVAVGGGDASNSAVDSPNGAATGSRRNEGSPDDGQIGDPAKQQPVQIMQGQGQSQNQGRRRRRLQVLTAHSFDHLDTSMHSTDRVVLAGLDVAPLGVTLDLAAGGVDGIDAAVEGGGKGAGTLEVDPLRGAVVVNAELAASSRVWCAGDVACYPSEAHGGSRRVLRTADHAHHSGKVAGGNMAAAARGEGGQRYRHSPAFVGEAPLAGVRLATIGDCDAALSTHGFWWTNSATRLTRRRTADSGQGSPNRPPLEEDKHPRPTGVTLRSRRTVRKDFTPVLGTGVVFYTSGPKVKGAMLWGFPGEVTAAAARGLRGSSSGDFENEASPADEAAGISARALELLRHIMERSADMEADLSDDRVMHAWIQGLTHAAKAVAQETGLGHLQPTRRSMAGRVTSSTRRPSGARDELMYQNTFKTSSAQRRLRAAYAARIQGVEPQPLPTYSTGGAVEAEFDPEVVEFLGYGGSSGVFGTGQGDDSGPPAQ